MAQKLPGSDLSSGNRLSALLANQPDYNNGTLTGGLAHVLRQYLEGSNARKDDQNQQAAMEAYVSGMSAKPWVNPDTGEVAPADSAGGYSGAATALQGLGDNPYARNLAAQLMMQKAQVDADNGQWQQRFDVQNQAQNERMNMQIAAQQAQQAQQIAAQEARMNREFADRMALEQMKADVDRATAGKYYAVPSGDGYFLIDKGSGMAVRMGMDSNGNPVQIGSTFQPAFNPGTGQPSPLPVPSGGPQMTPGAMQPGAAPQASGFQMPPPAGIQMPPSGMPQQPSGDIRPVMPPGIDPRAQYDVEREKKAGAIEGERIGSMPERLKAAKNAMSGLEAQQGVVQQDIDRAISLAQSGGFGPVGTTGLGSIMSVMPGSDAGNLASTLNTIKANIGFDKLQAMREASPTGGALGQVSDRENTLLQSVLGSLDQSQSQDQFVANLQRLKRVLSENQHVRRQAFEQDFGAVQQQPQQAPQMPGQRNLPPPPPGFQIQGQ